MTPRLHYSQEVKGASMMWGVECARSATFHSQDVTVMQWSHCSKDDIVSRGRVSLLSLWILEDLLVGGVADVPLEVAMVLVVGDQGVTVLVVIVKELILVNVVFD